MTTLPHIFFYNHYGNSHPPPLTPAFATETTTKSMPRWNTKSMPRWNSNSWNRRRRSQQKRWWSRNKWSVDHWARRHGIPASQDCQGSWSDWSACQDGMRTREYTVTQEKVGNGASCPVADGTVETDTSACGVNCQGSWSNWSSCQGGQRTREYIVTQEKVGNGASCPVADGTVQTDTSACSVDCRGSWSWWSDCLGGVRTRQYNVWQEKVGNGASCPAEHGATQADTSGCSNTSNFSPTFSNCDALFKAGSSPQHTLNIPKFQACSNSSEFTCHTGYINNPAGCSWRDASKQHCHEVVRAATIGSGGPTSVEVRRCSNQYTCEQGVGCS